MNPQPITQASFEPGTVLNGRYRVASLIGVGGVGRVYLARHLELECDVAVKVLRPEMSERADAVQRFAREARASVRLRSERIARVLDVGTHEGKPYFVMEYLVGCNLLEVREQPGIDIAALCEFFIQACEGLADAHAQGVVHRDIKPENLFVVKDASGWRSLKVLDFGISKFSLTGRFSDVDMTGMRTEAMMGTPHYISPEQIRASRDVDHRTDIWSLGAVMFEVVAGGILPFREEREVTALVAEVLERPHRSLLDVAPNAPERLASIVDRCLTKDRNLRYQTVAEVALDLLPLAPVRARASVERAVSVMQSVSMMPINGDMESMRRVPTLPSDMPPSNPARISGLLSEEVTGPGNAARRSSFPSEAQLSSVAEVLSVTALAPVALAPPITSVGPSLVPPADPVSPASTSSAAASGSHLAASVPPNTPALRQRRAILTVSVAAALLLGAVFLLSMLGAAPANPPSAATAAPILAVPKGPEPAATTIIASPPAADPTASSDPAASAAPSSSLSKKEPRKVIMYAPPRPAAPTPAKDPPPRSPDLPSSPPKLELRRER